MMMILSCISGHRQVIRRDVGNVIFYKMSVILISYAVFEVQAKKADGA